MIHKMNLYDNSFKAIKNGLKTIEMRLNDKKRQLIKEKDEIIFINLKTKEEIICSVIKLYRYNNFEELYMHHDKLAIGYKNDEIANPNDMLIYYSIEDIKKYGCLAIEIKYV